MFRTHLLGSIASKAFLSSSLFQTAGYCLNKTNFWGDINFDQREEVKNAMIYSWGFNIYGQLGLGHENQQISPASLNSCEGIIPKRMASSKYGTAIIDQDGNLYTWGRSKDGLQGHKFSTTSHNEKVPKQVEKVYGMKFVDVSVGIHHMGAITENGDIYTWGDVTHNKQGHSYESYSQKRSLRDSSPLGSKKNYVEEPTLQNIDQMNKENDKAKQIICRNNYTVVLSEKGKLYSFGYSKRGALAQDNLKDDCLPPTQIKALENHKIVKIKGGSEFLLALTDENKLFSWGYNNYGQLGNNAELFDNEPKRILSLARFSIVNIAAGENFSAAVDKQGKVWTWGQNNDGQLGHGTYSDLSTPLVQKFDKNVTKISAGEAHTSLLTDDGELYMCGSGKNGQLGRGGGHDSVASKRSSPTLVDFFTKNGKKVHDVGCGGSHTLAFVSDK